MTWKPTNQPTRYDQTRVERLEPISRALTQSGLPVIRLRKLKGILNAIEMQIEDGGDSPHVNALLTDALRAAVLHQIGDAAAHPALCALEAFTQAEAQRWERMKAGTLLPMVLKPDENGGQGR